MNEGGTRFWSDLEVELLIDEISEAALDAIEQAAGEAARAAVLLMLEREALALREANRWRMETEALSQEITAVKRSGRKNTIIGVLAGIFGGLVLGVGGTILMRN